MSEMMHVMLNRSSIKGSEFHRPDNLVGYQPHRSFIPSKEAPIVTIAFGFSYQSKEGEMPSIILASDSRISDGYHASSNREQKIISVMFNGDHCVLLAKAGIKTTADAFEEKFSEIAANTAIKTPRSVADAAEVAMRDVLARLNAGYTGDIDRRIADYESQFIMGFWHQGKPYFYTIGLQSRLATLRLPRFSGHAG